MATDRGRGADLEGGPAEFVFDLFVALLDPMPDAVESRDFGQVGGLVGRAGGVMRSARAGQIRGQAPGCLVRRDVRVGCGNHEAGMPVRSPPGKLGVGGPPGFGVPVAERSRTGVSRRDRPGRPTARPVRRLSGCGRRRRTAEVPLAGLKPW